PPDRNVVGVLHVASLPVRCATFEPATTRDWCQRKSDAQRCPITSFVWHPFTTKLCLDRHAGFATPMTVRHLSGQRPAYVRESALGTARVGERNGRTATRRQGSACVPAGIIYPARATRRWSVSSSRLSAVTRGKVPTIARPREGSLG